MILQILRYDKNIKSIKARIYLHHKQFKLCGLIFNYHKKLHVAVFIINHFLGKKIKRLSFKNFFSSLNELDP